MALTTRAGDEEARPQLRPRRHAAIAAAILAVLGFCPGAAAQQAGLFELAQADDAEQGGEPAPRTPGASALGEAPTAMPPGPDLQGEAAVPGELVHVPIVDLFVGGTSKEDRPRIRKPLGDNEAAVQRGMTYYNRFNCVGCHAPNGSGGMGPSLSNATFIYGGEPENIYLSILQGRPAGMPAWGMLLPDSIIWDLVAYIRSISKEPAGPWGKTISADGFEIEQVPAEFLKTADPWRYTTPFSYGQPPFEKPKGSPPLETPSQ